MNGLPNADTSLSDTAPEPRDLWRNNLLGAILFINLAGQSAYGIHKCFWDKSAATQASQGIAYQSSTQPEDISPELLISLCSVLDAARRDIIEDGMPNAITEHLPALIARGTTAVIAALASAINTGRVTPSIAAEVLKELGRLRDTASHASQRWVLEKALFSPLPFVRDGAGLGLARLGDPRAIPTLRKAIQSELHLQTKADLQFVVEELSDLITNAEPVARSY
jgi:hypothetical protein